VDPPTVKLSHLERAVEKLSKNVLMGVFDLRSCYFHVRLHKDHTKYFGIKHSVDGRECYMVFDYLPFGLNSAVHCVTKLFKLIITYLQMLDIPITIYIDDGLFLAPDQETWNKRRKIINEVISRAGWTIAEDKSDGPDGGFTYKKYLGFGLDTMQMKVYLPQNKAEKIKDLIRTCMTEKIVKAKFLAKVLGNIVACVPSHGPFARVCTRAGYCDLSITESKGWHVDVTLSESTVEEFKFFLQTMDLTNGFPIRSSLTDVRVDAFFPGAISKNDFVPVPRSKVNAAMVSDASNFKVACKWLEAQNGTWTFSLSQEEMRSSSGNRELLAVLKCLRHFDFSLAPVKGVNFIWATDSENLVSFLSKGSPKKHIQEKVFEIYQLCVKLDCTIEPLHLLRTDERIQQVDHLSKIKDTDNWSIDAFSFEKLKSEFQLNLDVFADAKNARLERFISKFYEQGAYAVDAFSVEWPGNCWVCPPTKLLLRTVKRIKNSKCKGIILVPMWPASNFYNEFFGKNENAKAPFQLVRFIQPYIFQNENATCTALFGVTKFKFAVFFFNTN